MWSVLVAESYEVKLASLSEAKQARRLKCHPETADGGAIGSGTRPAAAKWKTRLTLDSGDAATAVGAATGEVDDE